MSVILLLSAEAEAEASNLRRRGSDLERRAKQLRSERPAAAAKGPEVTATSLNQEAAQGADAVAHSSNVQLKPETDLMSDTAIPGPQALPVRNAMDSLNVLPAGQSIQISSEQAGTASVQSIKDPQQGVQQNMALDAQADKRLSATAPGAAPVAFRAPQRAREAAQTAREAAQTAPGLVVWGTVKGWPPWPAIVLTEEEMDVAGVVGQRGTIVKGILSSNRTQFITLEHIAILYVICVFVYQSWHDSKPHKQHI